ncbi:MAG: OmpA family protein [Fibrobacteraceae bacterium]
MNFSKLIAFGLFCFVGSFAAAKTGSCLSSIDALEKQLPANSAQIRLTIAEARTSAVDLENSLTANPNDTRNKSKASVCSLYVELIQTEISTQNSKNNVQANHKKQLQVRDSIERIQEKIGEVRSGKVSNLAADLDAERAKLARTSSAMDSAMIAAKTREEVNRKAALAREDSLNKLLAEERAKAEARQNEARNKLNDLQSKLIQVTQDARGIILSMSDILFDVDKATLKEDLKTSLAKVAGILSVYQELNVSVEGHTDNTGSADHNMKLSEQRAKNVLDFLVTQGIDAQRLSSKGYGMTMPVADNTTKEGRQKNRRVDLVIKDKALSE